MEIERLIRKYEKELEKNHLSCQRREALRREILRLRLALYDQRFTQPFEKKIEFSKQLIRKTVEKHSGKCAVACSFGKDSMVVLHLVLQFDPKVMVVYNNTGVEYPGTKEFKEKVKKLWGLNLVETWPEKTFWQCVQEYGYPKLRYKHGSPRCCYWLKEKPTKLLIKREGVEVLFLGLTGSESYQRKWTIVNYGPRYHTRKNAPYEIVKVHPIAYWKEEEVWRYIRENDVPVHPAYSYTNRIGCLPCTGYKDWMILLARVNPRLLRKILKDRSESKRHGEGLSWFF